MDVLRGNRWIRLPHQRSGNRPATSLANTHNYPVQSFQHMQNEIQHCLPPKSSYTLPDYLTNQSRPTVSVGDASEISVPEVKHRFQLGPYVEST